MAREKGYFSNLGLGFGFWVWVLGSGHSRKLGLGSDSFVARMWNYTKRDDTQFRIQLGLKSESFR